MRYTMLMLIGLLLTACDTRQRDPEYWNCVKEASNVYNECMVNATTAENVQACQKQRYESYQYCDAKYPLQ